MIWEILKILWIQIFKQSASALKLYCSAIVRMTVVPVGLSMTRPPLISLRYDDIFMRIPRAIGRALDARKLRAGLVDQHRPLLRTCGWRLGHDEAAGLGVGRHVLGADRAFLPFLVIVRAGPV